MFEGAPLVAAPLVQSIEARRPLVTDGEALDTVAACPPLSLLEKARLAELRAREAHRLVADCAAARASFIRAHSERLAKRAGISVEAAAKIVARQCDGVLLPDIALEFDDQQLAGATVADVLADPERFEGATLADPLEGITYGACKAKVMVRSDGTPWIHSFAHGRTIYELKRDARAALAVVEQVPVAEVAATAVKLAATADLNAAEVEQLRDLVAKRSGIGKREVNKMFAEAQKEHTRQRIEDARKQRAAERRDARPAVDVPAADAPWLPQAAVVEDALSQSPDTHPPMRDIDAYATETSLRRVLGTNAFGSDSANAMEEGEQV